MEVVILLFQQYEYLSMFDEVFEWFEIAHNIKSRVRHYDVSKSVSWESIKEDWWKQKKSINKEIEKLKINPFAGGELGNKDNIDLTGFYKLYACNKSIRIVYRLISPKKVEIVEILGIGKRDKLRIYRTVGDRLNKSK